MSIEFDWLNLGSMIIWCCDFINYWNIILASTVHMITEGYAEPSSAARLPLVVLCCLICCQVRWPETTFLPARTYRSYWVYAIFFLHVEQLMALWLSYFCSSRLFTEQVSHVNAISKISIDSQFKKTKPSIFRCNCSMLFTDSRNSSANQTALDLQ